MDSKLTLCLDDKLAAALDRVCAATGLSRGDIVLESVRREVARMEFARIRSLVMPYAEAQGYVHDEDVYRDVS